MTWLNLATSLGVAFLAISCFGQNLSGTWQGREKGGDDLEIILTIHELPDRKFEAYYQQRGQSQSVPVDKLTLTKDKVDFVISLKESEFSGKADSDGTSLVGVWKHAGRGYPISFTRPTTDTKWSTETPPLSLTTTEAKRFHIEVATIKPSEQTQRSASVSVSGRTLYLSGMTVTDLLRYAFNLQPVQIMGVPKAFGSRRFDVVILPDQTGPPVTAQYRSLTKELLTERFGLVFRNIDKASSVYALTVTKPSERLVRATSSERRRAFLKPEEDGQTLVMEKNATMTEFASFLTTQLDLDKMVVDHTGLAGGFDFEFEFQPGGATQAVDSRDAPPVAPDPSGNFHALKSQLGLSLKPAKATVPCILVERLDEPTPN